jgi:succinoglycan biosynthesis transport protein ExoP
MNSHVYGDYSHAQSVVPTGPQELDANPPSFLHTSSGGGYEEQGGRFDLRWCIGVLFKHKYLIMLIVAATFLIGLVATLMATRLYTAVATIQIDQKSIKVIEGNDVLQNQNEQDFIRTQIEILKSRTLAERVVTRLALDRNSKFLASKRSLLSRITSPFRGENQTDSTILRARAIARVIDNSSATLVRLTRIVKINYTDKNPVLAQRIANAVADGYLQLNLDRRIESSSYAKNFLEDQIGIMKTKVQESERALVDYAEKNRIIDFEDKNSLASQNLADANAALSKAINERIKAEQLWKQAVATPGLALPQLLENKYIERLRLDLTEQKTKYQDMLGTFKPSYPSMIRLKARITELERNVTSEVRTVKKSLKGAFDSAKYREDLATLQVEQLKTVVLNLAKRSINYVILKREAQTNRTQLEGLLSRYKEVGVASGVGANNISIVDRAKRPESPSSPRTAKNLLLSLGIGMFFGLGIAFLREFLDDSINDPHDLEAAINRPSLGLIPALDDPDEIQLALDDRFSPLSEAYRSLATTLMFSTGTGTPKTLFITSAQPGEGKSTTALSLALQYANNGSQVLLIDADLRKPSIHRKLDLNNELGLSNYLTAGCRAPEAMQQHKEPNLFTITSGPIPPNPVELLNSPRMLSLLSIGSEKFDIVIVDGPPVMGLADAPILSSMCMGTLFVAAAHETKTSVVRTAVRRLHYARAKVIGFVMTRFYFEKTVYGYNYGYEYNYGSSPNTLSDESQGTRKAA